MQRRLAILCLAMALMPSLFPPAPRAEGRLSIAPDTAVTIYEQFTIEVTVNDGIEQLMGYDITVDVDDSFLEVVDVEEGSLPAGSLFDTFFRWMNPACACDSVHVNGSILGNTVNGPGTLFAITVRAIRLGTTTVSVRRSDLRNGLNERLPHGVENAVVMIEPPERLVILPPLTNTDLYDVFQLEIAVNDEIDSLMGYNVTIDFDDTFLQLVDLAEGSLPKSSGYATFFRWMNPGCNCDSAFVNGSILGHVVDGPGTLFTMTFRSLQLGTTDVRIRRSDLRSGVNARIVHARRDGIVIVHVPPTGAEPPAAPQGTLVNYPNPFNPSTTLSLWLPADRAPTERAVTIGIYSVSGVRVRSLFSGSLPPGTSSIVWDGKDDGGVSIAAGVYFAVAESSCGALRRTLVLVR